MISFQTVLPPPVSVQVRGGCLCDEMGVGKTLEVIGLILARPPPATKAPSAADAGPSGIAAHGAAAAAVGITGDTAVAADADAVVEADVPPAKRAKLNSGHFSKPARKHVAQQSGSRSKTLAGMIPVAPNASARPHAPAGNASGQQRHDSSTAFAKGKAPAGSQQLPAGDTSDAQQLPGSDTAGAQQAAAAPPAASQYPLAGKTCGGTLVVTPPALLQQWVNELQHHSPGLKVKIYDGLKWHHQEVSVGHSDIGDCCMPRGWCDECTLQTVTSGTTRSCFT